MQSRKAALMLAVLALASGAMHAARAEGTRPTTATASEAMADGEIRKVDAAAKKITIRHGELRNLDMPAMTMVFHVGDPAMLEAVKVGDKVHFRADRIGGALTVVELAPAK